jgi:hypothetical protein
MLCDALPWSVFNIASHELTSSLFNKLAVSLPCSEERMHIFFNVYQSPMTTYM